MLRPVWCGNGNRNLDRCLMTPTSQSGPAKESRRMPVEYAIGATAAPGVPVLPAAIASQRREIVGRAGRLSYYKAGEGPPLLLIHSVNAAASAYEVGPLFAPLASIRRVYAVDLPGFGLSDRSDRSYDIDLYLNAVRDMLDVIGGDAPGQRIDALAISLSSEFLARISLEAPDRFRTVTFVTPTGFDKRSATFDGAPGSTREIPGLHAIVSFKPWGRGLFNLLVSRRGIRYFLEKTFGSKDIEEGLLQYDYVTAHQPGAEHAPFAFVSGRLFSEDIRAVYARIAQPVWMPHGTRGDFADFTGADWVYGRPGWTVEPWPTGALPHFEMPCEFVAAFEKFIKSPKAGETR
jgi:pimeloyl-ACP methyl ester carboxylesterase